MKGSMHLMHFTAPYQGLHNENCVKLQSNKQENHLIHITVMGGFFVYFSKSISALSSVCHCVFVPWTLFNLNRKKGQVILTLNNVTGCSLIFTT